MQSIHKYTYLILIIFFTNCSREDSDQYILIDQTEDETEYYFDSHFVGYITDENGNVIPNAKISIGDITSTSSTNGIFLMDNIKTNSSGQIIKVEADGYDTYVEHVLKLENHISNHAIVLTKNAKNFIIDPQAAQKLQIDDQLSIDVVENSFKREDGNLPNGDIIIKIQKDFIKQDFPFISLNLQKGILDDGSIYQIEAYDAQGAPLISVQPLTIQVRDNNKRFGILEISKNKWKEVAMNTQNVNTFSLPNLTPFICGKFNDISKVKTRMVDVDGSGVTLMKAQIILDNNQSKRYIADQDGYLYFYTKSPSQINIQILGGCNNILISEVRSLTENSILDLPDYIIQNQDITKINSNIKNCSSPITDMDRVNVKFIEEHRSAVVYQTKSVEEFRIPKCQNLLKADYYKSNKKQFSINLSKPIDDSIFNIKTDPFCVDTYSGSMVIAGQEKHFNQGDFYIIKDKNRAWLTITDLNTFSIVIPNEITSEALPVFEFFSTFPDVTYCDNAQCNELKGFLNYIDMDNTNAKIKINGNISGVDISATFEKKIQ
ncbi:MAG: carboxypeptidase-like regulatory domain-containing protein [Saprospiraceae bacterium]